MPSISLASAREMVADYLNKVETLAAGSRIRRIAPEALHSSMTGEQRTRYAIAIHQVLETTPERAISPDVLFRAADLAVSGETSNIEARVGLQPGTMNPVHYGHLSASLAAIIANTMDVVLLMSGGNVPDK